MEQHKNRCFTHRLDGDVTAQLNRSKQQWDAVIVVRPRHRGQRIGKRRIPVKWRFSTHLPARTQQHHVYQSRWVGFSRWPAP
jgi:hypothetical protein